MTASSLPPFQDTQIAPGQEVYRATVEGLPVPAYMTDAEGVVTAYNQAAADLWGRAPVIGETMWCGSLRAYHLDGRPMPLAECPMAVAIKEKRIVEAQEVEVERPDGSRLILLAHPKPLLDESGRVYAALNILIDITTGKRAALAYQVAEQRFRLLADDAPVKIWLAGPDKALTYFNHRWLNFTGRSLGQEIGFGWLEVVHPEDRDEFVAMYEGAFEARELFHTELRLRRADGEYRWMLANGTPLVDGQGVLQGFTGTFLDITDDKRNQSRLRLLSKAGWTLNESLDVQDTVSRLTELIVPALADWALVHLVEDGELKQVAVSHRDPHRARQAQAMEDTFPAASLDVDFGPAHVVRTGKSEMHAEVTAEMLGRAARDVRHLGFLRRLRVRSYIGVPIRGKKGVMGALTLVLSDSGRRYDDADLHLAEAIGLRAGVALEHSALYELSELTRRQLQESNMAKNEFLGIVSHELRTPLTTIYSGSRLLTTQRHILEEGDRASLIDDIAHEAEKMRSMVENLLMLARLESGQAVEKRSVELRDTVDAAVRSGRASGRTVNVQYETRRERVNAEPTFLAQIIENLVSNAAKYSEGDLELIVSEAPAHLRFSMLDRGPGVEPAELPLLFDSFYRSTRTAHLQGKGLGLATCKRLVEAQGGSIWAMLRAGGGMEVAFTLPLN